MSGYDGDAREPQIAAERTDLAWSRTGLAILALGALIVRGIGRLPLAASNLARGVYILVLGALTLFLGAWHASGTRRRRERRTTMAEFASIAYGVAVIGIAAFIVSARG